MVHANALGGVVAYLMEALCMMGVIVMLTFLRALLAEGRRGRKEEMSGAAAEQAEKSVITDDDINEQFELKSLGASHSWR